MGAGQAQGKKPLIAALLSFLVWGGGQIYNKQFGLGIIFFILMGDAAALAAVVFPIHSHFGQLGLPGISPSVSTTLIYNGGLLFILIFWIFNILQAYFTAFSLNRSQRKKWMLL